MTTFRDAQLKDIDVVETCQLVEKIRTHDFVMECLLLCIASRKLYNTGLYLFRQQWFKNNTFLTYAKLASVLKSHSTFKALPAKVAQQTLMMLAQDIKSFCALKQSQKLNEVEKKKVKLPNYKPYFSPVVYTRQALSKKAFNDSGLIQLSGVNVAFASQKIQQFDQICQVRIIPTRQKHLDTLSAEDFRIEVVYDADLSKLAQNPAVKIYRALVDKASKKGESYQKEEVVAVEVEAEAFVGVDQNLDALVSTDARAYSLKPLKSVNHYWNKVVAKLKSEITKLEQALENSEKRQILTPYSTTCLKNTIHKLRRKIKRHTRYRNHFVENFTHQLSCQFINQLSEKVQLIIYGKNVNFKKEISLGKVNNQNFVQLPFNKIIEKLRYKAMLKGIHFMTVEESYTSKTSFLDKEPLQTYREKGKNPSHTYLGKRIERGLFRSAKGHTLHADLNAAWNIARKVIGEEIYRMVSLEAIMGSALKKVKVRLA